MQPHEYETLRSMEERHWWYLALRRLVLQELDKALPVGACVLDAGCGAGGMMDALRRLQPDWLVRGVDIAEAALQQCRARGLAAVQMADVAALPFADESFEAVLCLDVLYHQQVDEALALHELNRVLKPNGVLVLNLPAFACLRGRHDDAVCGARRYTVCHVRQQLQRVNLAVMKLHYWNAWSFPLLLLWRQLSRLQSLGGKEAVTSDLFRLPDSLNHFLAWLAHLDAKVCHRGRIPLGSSVFAVARKSPSPTSHAHGC